ncbi:MAG: hypothetical protein HC933_12190 [Pleurocapsa sp. SU_196_0]|nr:hypothetical protein [Pleurocapsa sp. SU_196_0]
MPKRASPPEAPRALLERAAALERRGRSLLEQSAQLRLEALRAVFDDVVFYGAMLEADVLEEHGGAALEGLWALKWVEAQDTPLGKVLYASHRGRKKVQGLFSYYVPETTALLNAVARRRAVAQMVAQGYRLMALEGVQGQIIRMKDARGRDTIVFARHGGYKAPGLKRAVEALLEELGGSVRFVAFVEDLNDHEWVDKSVRLELHAFSELVH